ncbi:hypothetical protein [Actinoplanes sp. NPDC026670]|uniref:phage terminase small subunit n=1 Tax=Actinoplanes sp. NPDC026670 TaxID=3154700 RepID=UPI0033CC3EA1
MVALGSRGPIPNREEDLARPRERRGSEEQSVTKGVARKVRWPKADDEWHPLAKEIYNGCRLSGQADFYQQSDIALLRSLMDDLTVAKRNPAVRSGQLLQTLYSQLSNLLVAEGDRRRVRIELTEPSAEETSAEVIAINAYQKALGVAN